MWVWVWVCVCVGACGYREVRIKKKKVYIEWIPNGITQNSKSSVHQKTFKDNTYGSVYVLYTVIYMYKPKRGENLYKNMSIILSPGHISVATLGAKPGETASSGGMYLS